MSTSLIDFRWRKRSSSSTTIQQQQQQRPKQRPFSVHYESSFESIELNQQQRFTNNRASQTKSISNLNICTYFLDRLTSRFRRIVSRLTMSSDLRSSPLSIAEEQQQPSGHIFDQKVVNRRQSTAGQRPLSVSTIDQLRYVV
jgi:hypothetical protein